MQSRLFDRFFGLSLFFLFLAACRKELDPNSQNLTSSADGSQSSGQTVPTITPLRPISSDGNGFVLQLIGRSTCPADSKFTRERYIWGEEQKDKAIEKIRQGCSAAIAEAKKNYSAGEWARTPLSKCEGMCPKNLNMQVQKTKKGFNVTGGVTGTGKVESSSESGETTNDTVTSNSTGSSNSNTVSSKETTVTETCTMSTESEVPELQCVPNSTAKDSTNTTAVADRKNDRTSNSASTTSNSSKSTKTLEITANLSFSVDLSATSTSVESIQCVSADTTERFYSSLLDLLKVCE